MVALAPNPQADLDAKVAMAKYGDLQAYALAVHNMEIEPYQLIWDHALETANRVVIVCPPGTYKSTTVQMWVERKIGRDPSHRILWIMNSGTQSERRVTEVGRTITGNRVYRKAFSIEPDPEGQWSKSSLYVMRPESHPDPTLFGSGWDGPYQGLHCHTIILDDLTDQKDVYSPATMEMQRIKLRGVIRDRLEDGGRMIVLMTRWGVEDLLPTLEDMGFTIIEMPVISDKYPWGPTISNKRFPMDEMDALRQDKTDALFELTYMCNPEAAQGGIIKRDHIQYYDKDSLPQHGCYALMALDPAISTKTWSDPSALGIGLLDPQTGRLYLTDMFGERMDAIQLEKYVVRHAKQTAGLIAVGVETVSYQASIAQRLKQLHHLPIVELPYRTRRQAMHKQWGLDRNKEGRAYYLDYKLSQGQVLLPNPKFHRLPLVDGVSLETELTSFPGSRHDDRLDCLSFLCALADTYTRPALLKAKITAWSK